VVSRMHAPGPHLWVASWSLDRLSRIFALIGLFMSLKAGAKQSGRLALNAIGLFEGFRIYRITPLVRLPFSSGASRLFSMQLYSRMRQVGRFE
jgi:hypothetical protein